MVTKGKCKWPRQPLKNKAAAILKKTGTMGTHSNGSKYERTKKN